MSELIDRLEKIANHVVHAVGVTPYLLSLDDGIAIHEAIEILKTVSAQPNYDCVLKQFGDCTYDTTGCSDCVIKAKIRVALSAQPEPKWIPVSERLPEENGEYLVTRESKGIYKYVDIVKKTNTSGDIAGDIVAWMPLPKPYAERRTDDSV